MAFRPTRGDVDAALADARGRWAKLSAPQPASAPFDDVRAAYEAISRHAHDISGTTHDDERRAVLYFAIFEDSGRSFMFPLIASHGSMWGVSHTERLDRLITPMLRVSRRGRVQRWLDGLDAVRDVNRRVFREIYTTFYFTRYFGRHPRAGELVNPDVLALYNRVHDAVARGERLDPEARRAVYFDVFVHEQEDIVDPGLKDAAAWAGPLLVRLTKRVSPRFTYFPGLGRLW